MESVRHIQHNFFPQKYRNIVLNQFDDLSYMRLKSNPWSLNTDTKIVTFNASNGSPKQHVLLKRGEKQFITFIQSQTNPLLHTLSHNRFEDFFDSAFLSGSWNPNPPQRFNTANIEATLMGSQIRPIAQYDNRIPPPTYSSLQDSGNANELFELIKDDFETFCWINGPFRNWDINECATIFTQELFPIEDGESWFETNAPDYPLYTFVPNKITDLQRDVITQLRANKSVASADVQEQQVLDEIRKKPFIFSPTRDRFFKYKTLITYHQVIGNVMHLFFQSEKRTIIKRLFFKPGVERTTRLHPLLDDKTLEAIEWIPKTTEGGGEGGGGGGVVGETDSTVAPPSVADAQRFQRGLGFKSFDKQLYSHIMPTGDFEKKLLETSSQKDYRRLGASVPKNKNIKAIEKDLAKLIKRCNESKLLKSVQATVKSLEGELLNVIVTNQDLKTQIDGDKSDTYGYLDKTVFSQLGYKPFMYTDFDAKSSSKVLATPFRQNIIRVGDDICLGRYCFLNHSGRHRDLDVLTGLIQVINYKDDSQHIQRVMRSYELQEQYVYEDGNRKGNFGDCKRLTTVQTSYGLYHNVRFCTVPPRNLYKLVSGTLQSFSDPTQVLNTRPIKYWLNIPLDIFTLLHQGEIYVQSRWSAGLDIKTNLKLLPPDPFAQLQRVGKAEVINTANPVVNVSVSPINLSRCLVFCNTDRTRRFQMHILGANDATKITTAQWCTKRQGDVVCAPISNVWIIPSSELLEVKVEKPPKLTTNRIGVHNSSDWRFFGDTSFIATDIVNGSSQPFYDHNVFDFVKNFISSHAKALVLTYRESKNAYSSISLNIIGTREKPIGIDITTSARSFVIPIQQTDLMNNINAVSKRLSKEILEMLDADFTPHKGFREFAASYYAPVGSVWTDTQRRALFNRGRAPQDTHTYIFYNEEGVRNELHCPGDLIDVSKDEGYSDVEVKPVSQSLRDELGLRGRRPPRDNSNEKCWYCGLFAKRNRRLRGLIQNDELDF